MRQLKIEHSITNRSASHLEKYFNEINKIPLLSIDEEVELAKRIRDKDQLAVDQLVKSNLKFVVSVAKVYQNRGLSLSDLINEGNLGLHRAAQGFDERKGFKFITYAVWWIRQAILQAINTEGRMVRLPWNRLKDVNDLEDIYSILCHKLEREPTTEEIAEYFKEYSDVKLDALNIEFFLEVKKPHSSLDAPFQDEEDNTLLDILESDLDRFKPENINDKEDLSIKLQSILKKLKPIETGVIRLHFGLDGHRTHSLKEISEMIGKTTERTRQIKDVAIRKLRQVQDNKVLMDYLK